MSDSYPFKLTEEQKIILGSIEFHGNRPLSQIAPELSLKEDRLRSIIRWLKDSGVIINVLPVINPYLIGYHYQSLFFNSHSIANSKKIIDAFIASEFLVWHETQSGEFEHYVSFCVQNPLHIDSLFRDISHKHGAIFSRKKLLLPLRYVEYGSRILKDNDTTVPITTNNQQASVSVDDTDITILRMIGKGMIPIRDIASSCGLSQSMVQRRINRFEEAGVISHYRYIYNLERCGIKRRIGIISLSHKPDSFMKALQSFALETPSVTGYIECLGDFDLLIRFQFESSDTYLETRKTFLSTFSDFVEQTSWYERLFFDKYGYF